MFTFTQVKTQKISCTLLKTSFYSLPKMNAIWLFLFLKIGMTSTLQCVPFYIFSFFSPKKYVISPLGKNTIYTYEKEDRYSQWKHLK